MINGNFSGVYAERLLMFIESWTDGFGITAPSDQSTLGSMDIVKSITASMDFNTLNESL
jgi:hypothetical protein